MKKPVYASRIKYEVPGALSQLAGPLTGVIKLPRSIYWGPETTVDLADPVDVQRMYQAVVRSGTQQQQERWLNRNLLIATWPSLVLPVRCHMKWESEFSELTSLSKDGGRRWPDGSAASYGECVSESVDQPEPEPRHLVRLSDTDSVLMSRSEARRVLSGASGFAEVDVDFTGVEYVGQGFADEVFRVWPSLNPGVQVNPINMIEAVEFMVRRALPR